jgi:hypothetical protein
MRQAVPWWDRPLSLHDRFVDWLTGGQITAINARARKSHHEHLKRMAELERAIAELDRIARERIAEYDRDRSPVDPGSQHRRPSERDPPAEG